MDTLDNNLVVGTVLMDLSKVFDCISYDLSTAKMTAYRIQNESLSLYYSLILLIETRV